MPYISKTEAKRIEELKQSPELKELINGMSEIVGVVKDISLRLSKIENEVSVPKEQPKPQVQATITENSVFPVPIDYRQEVEKKFNKKFGVRVEPNDALPEFKFTILVPREYSPLNDSEWEMSGGEDKRMRVITYSQGLTGVQEWIEKVYNNFNSETRAKIQADRIN